MPRRLIFGFAPAGLVLLAIACDSGLPPGPIPVHPVHGQVTYQGKPVAGALVVFHRAAATPGASGADSSHPPVPTGKTDAQGRFQVHTYVGNDGAPAGEYKVTVVPAGASERRNVMEKNAGDVAGPTLPARYADPNRSGLTATVKAAEAANVLPPFTL